MPEFFRVITPAQVFEALSSFPRLGTERIRLEDALFRVLAEEIISPENLPVSSRATMDGYAVRAADTFGASESLPAFHSVVGQVNMGMLPKFEVKNGQAAEIPTGGFLPKGADAVVMVEYTRPIGHDTIEVVKPVTIGENVLDQGGDVAKGEVLLLPGRRFRPQDVGLMAGLGLTDVLVFQRPKVVVVSTGNEIVPIHQCPSPGQIRDINSYSLSALVRTVGAEPIMYGVIPDDTSLLKERLERGIMEGDVVVVSGGSSVGERDLMGEVVARLPNAKILVHGVALSPGKPTLLAKVTGKALFGLPGHPVSTMIVAQIFLMPFLKFICGEELERGPLGSKVKATLATSIPSAHGREEYFRVKLEEKNGELYARPVFGKSSMISTMVKSDGLIVVSIHAEGLAKGERVNVILF